MSDSAAGLLTALAVVVVLAVTHVPLGDYMARVYQATKHGRCERWLYRVCRVDPDVDQTWSTYALSLLGFSFVSVVFLYVLERVQSHLPSSLGLAGVEPHLAWNTAASFVTNTNWQNYSGETTMGNLVQMAGLALQNFASAAVGMAVAVALVRGFARSRTNRVGNFWVDLVRGCLRILLPLAAVAAVVLIACGVVQNLSDPHTVHTLTGGTQHLRGGPVASQEAIKELGNNGGGPDNANSAHPFENPNGFTNLLEIVMLLLLPFALPRTFGRMLGDKRQGWAILSAMAVVLTASLTLVTVFEAHHSGSALNVAGSAMEGKETRFGVPSSALFAGATTLTSTGAVNAMHDSMTPLSGGVEMLNMMFGEVAPGGVGSGLYGMLVLAVITVFVAGLMVGRTPEYLGKKIRSREVKFAALYILTTPAVVLVGTGVAMSVPSARASMLNAGPHGLSEVLYAFTSQGNNNGSAFAGLTGNTDFYNIAGGLAMLVGRFLPMLLVLGLAGSLAAQKPVPVTEGTLPTHRPLFVGMLVGVVVIVVALTYFPALALGPLAEGLSR
ncbi:MAG TPA: potassium-transporting ATPase subunit KdpA [Nocardioides sp.]|jgi:K+-transporting ATPase ATPase A chain|uniref:potassium-transporting ATPase subunit KdpA n=1 Tax=Nocardioides sp. TaxID=35761 RepID=UPI002E2EB6E1|nr:potassium-transporting ATPase subunit KdpA [Nocardioides sp.]HEX3929872.1 potassium-transporting ATPase subunit KdpA [Nocardioides sp.]